MIAGIGACSPASTGTHSQKPGERLAALTGAQSGERLAALTGSQSGERLAALTGSQNHEGRTVLHADKLPAIKDAIAYLRTREGMSARRLSLSAGLSPSYIGKLEAGEIEPSVRAFGKIALALHMTPLEVLYCVRREAVTT